MLPDCCGTFPGDSTGKHGLRFGAISMFIAGASVAFAQLPAAASAFEVASVRTVDPDRSMSIIRSGNSLTFSNYSLEMPILWEWNIRSDRLLGKPKGLDSVRYDIVTAASEGPRPRTANR